MSKDQVAHKNNKMAMAIIIPFGLIGLTIVLACGGAGNGIIAPVSKLTAEEAGYRDRLNDIYSHALQEANRIVEASRRSSEAATELERLSTYSGKDREAKEQRQEQQRKESDDAVRRAAQNLSQLADKAVDRLRKVVPPEDMVSIHECLIALLEAASHPLGEDSAKQLTHTCQRLGELMKDFDRVVSVRPPRTDVASPVELTFTVPPISVSSVSGLKPEFTIPVGAASVTIGKNENYGAKRLVLRDSAGNERYFLMDRGFLYRQGPNDGFAIKLEQETLVLTMAPAR
jgi:hypothetical protein